MRVQSPGALISLGAGIHDAPSISGSMRPVSMPRGDPLLNRVMTHAGERYEKDFLLTIQNVKDVDTPQQ